MAPLSLIEQLLALPDIAAQRAFLHDHAAALDEAAASALKGQADRFLRSDIHRSLETADLLVEMTTLTGDPRHRALGLLARGNAQGIGLGEYQLALPCYEEAAAIYRTHGTVVEQATAQIGKLWPLASLGRYEEALATGEWAAEVLEQHEQWLQLAKLTSNLGIICGRQGQDRIALRMFDRARELYRQLGTAGESFLPRVEYNRAIVLRNLGRFAESITASEAALALLERMDQVVDVARARQGLAITYFVLGRYNEALATLDRVGEVFWTDGRQRDAVLVELFISDCLLQLGRFSDVLEKCTRVRDLFSGLGTHYEVAQAILNEAGALAGLQRYDEALASLSEARRLFEDEGNRTWEALTDLERAAVLYQQGQFSDSLALAQQCAALLTSASQPPKAAHALLIAARAAAALQQPDLGRELALEALAIGEQGNIPALTLSCHHVLGVLSQGRGDLQRALAELDQAIGEMERLRGRLMVEFRADFLADKHALYEDMVQLCLDLEQPQRGLEYAERAKSRALLDMIAYRLDLSLRARHEEDEHLVAQLVELRAERDCLYRRIEGGEELAVRGWSPGNTEQLQAQQDVLALEKQITDLWHRLLIRNADYARDAALWQVRTEAVQPYLSEDTALLEYFAVHGQFVVFLVTREAVQSCRLSDSSEVHRLLQLLWLNLKTVPRCPPSQLAGLEAHARGLLQKLYRLILAPLAAELAPYPRVVIVPHGPLHYLPFHALYDGASFLLQEKEVSYLPGASLLRYCREARPAEGGALVVGHSCGGRLPYTVQEARTVADLVGEQAWLEDAATLEQLRSTMRECRLVHLAAHGEFRPDNPLFSGLALADGWLTTLDIFNLRLQASLVTLSACQTGQSVVGGGDELLGLMRAFLYAGAASLILSLWMVEDRCAAQLMAAMYGRLAAGWTKGAALRAAQLQLIQGEGPEEEGGARRHPYFWAPFFLVGETGKLFSAPGAVPQGG
jgi:CHAT domain-containing protein